MLLDLDAGKAGKLLRPADRQPGRQRADPRAAEGLRGGARPAALIRRARGELTWHDGKSIMLPEQKLDALVTRHKAIESELSTQLAPDTYVKLSREFAELEPVVEAIKAYRAVAAEIADLDALLADPTTDAEMRRSRRPRSRCWSRSAPRSSSRSARAAPEGRDGRAQRHPGNPRRHRRRRGLAVRRRPVPHVRALRRQAGLEGRGGLGERRHAWAATRKSSPRSGAAAPSPS